ncbi:sphingolipid delta-4 desaturase [Polyrhizophydium stewartii]|uniref:Sphingolipid delta-4 desaturase n=1 Tax=Polyrhizophydium stewartii TaxID=2732419 RepID=A0ABR4MX48_9FUNG
MTATDDSLLRRRQETTKAPAVKGAYDSRHPTYLGEWKRSIPGVDDDIAVDDTDEPHIKRRHVMLQKYPNITKLYGIEPSTKYIVLFAVVAQLSMAYAFGRVWTNVHPAVFVAAAFVVGGSVTQLIGVLIHEAAHGLIFESTLLNRIAGVFVNLGLPVPIAASFRRYHLEHHAYQGVVGRDPDLPLDFEIQLVRGNPLLKIIFIMLYPVMYLVRGLAMQKAPSDWEYINAAVIVFADVCVYKFCGPTGLLYMFLSLWFGYSIHPAAAHFIQEHFTFDDGQETYSYYGALNIPFLNIGYHNEHHDFTKIPWTKLPTLKAMAPEFYDSLASHSSWVKVHWDFIFDKTLGPQSRVGRSYEDHKRGRKMVTSNKVVADEAKYWEDTVTAPMTRTDSGVVAK